MNLSIGILKIIERIAFCYFILIIIISSDNNLLCNDWKSIADSISILIDKDNYSEAIQLGEETLTSFNIDSKHNKLDSNLIKIVRSLSSAYYYTNQNSIALDYAVYDSSLSYRLYGDESLKYAESLNNLALSYWNNGDMIMAEKLLNKAGSLRNKQLGKYNYEYYNSIYNLALLHFSNSEYDKAEPLLKEVSDVSHNVFGENSTEYAYALNFLGRLYYNTTRYIDAEPLYKKALIIFRTHFSDNPDYPAIMNNIALLYTDMGRFSDAEQYLLDALMMREKIAGANSADYAQSLNSLGYFYYYTGNLNNSEIYYDKAIDVIKNLNGEDDITYATYINNLALLYIDMGRLNAAEKLYNKSSSIIFRKLGGNHPYYAQTLNNLGFLYDKMERLAEADSLYKLAIEAKKNILGEASNEYAKSLNNLAFLYLKTGRFNQAEELFKKSIRIDSQTLGAEHPSLAVDINNLGILYFYQKYYAEAEKLLKESYNIRSEKLSQYHPDYLQSLSNLALLYYERGDFITSELYFIKMLDSYIALVNKTFLYLSEREKEQFYDNIKKHFYEFSSFAIDYSNIKPEITGTLYDYHISTKGIILDASRKLKRKILKSNDKNLISKFNDLISIKSFLAKLYNISKDELKSMNVNPDSIESESNILEKELELISSGLSKERTIERKRWKDIQNKLNDNEAAIEIIRINKFGRINTDFGSHTSNIGTVSFPGLTDQVIYAALIIKKEFDYPQLVILDNSNNIETELINDYRKIIELQRKGKINLSDLEIKMKSMYDQLWSKIQKKIIGVSTVYLSLDGAYNLYNINTLINSTSGKYLLDEINIIYLNNTSEILKHTESSIIFGKAALFGNPVFNPDSNAADTSKTRFGISRNSLIPLPGTKAEVENIAKLMNSMDWNVKTYLDKSATETSLKLIDEPTVLHIATHGVFLKASNESNTRLFFESAALKENPLLKSMLFLSGSGNSLSMKYNFYDETDDGILNAYEAANLSLDGTSLVVLSACETGLGEIKIGEGVYGLRRAFQIAGARAIIMSLWKVGDQTAQELMTSFYSKWLNGKSKTDAFREAQLDLKNKYPAFYHWGAFVLFGI